MSTDILDGEYELEASAGKYPKTAFSGIFHGYEITENKNKTKVLRLLFDEDTIVEIYGRGKLDNGKAPGKLGEYIASLAVLGIRSIAQQDNNELVNLRHIPTIEDGSYRMFISPIIEKKVGDDQQTQDSTWWGHVDKLEKVKTQTPAQAPAAPVTKPGKLPKAPKTKEAPEDISDLLIEALADAPMTVSELFVKLGKAHKVSELRVALESLKSQGMITEDNNKWVVT